MERPQEGSDILKEMKDLLRSYKENLEKQRQMATQAHAMSIIEEVIQQNQNPNAQDIFRVAIPEMQEMEKIKSQIYRMRAEKALEEKKGIIIPWLERYSAELGEVKSAKIRELTNYSVEQEQELWMRTYRTMAGEVERIAGDEDAEAFLQLDRELRRQAGAKREDILEEFDMAMQSPSLTSQAKEDLRSLRNQLLSYERETQLEIEATYNELQSHPSSEGLPKRLDKLREQLKKSLIINGSATIFEYFSERKSGIMAVLEMIKGEIVLSTKDEENERSKRFHFHNGKLAAEYLEGGNKGKRIPWEKVAFIGFGLELDMMNALKRLDEEGMPDHGMGLLLSGLDGASKTQVQHLFSDREGDNTLLLRNGVERILRERFEGINLHAEAHIAYASNNLSGYYSQKFILPIQGQGNWFIVVDMPGPNAYPDAMIILVQGDISAYVSESMLRYAPGNTSQPIHLPKKRAADHQDNNLVFRNLVDTKIAEALQRLSRNEIETNIAEKAKEG